jgi:hypothetical protein
MHDGLKVCGPIFGHCSDDLVLLLLRVLAYLLGRCPILHTSMHITTYRSHRPIELFLQQVNLSPGTISTQVPYCSPHFLQLRHGLEPQQKCFCVFQAQSPVHFRTNCELHRIASRPCPPFHTPLVRRTSVNPRASATSCERCTPRH